MTRGHDAGVVVVIVVKGTAVGRDEVRPMKSPIGSGGQAVGGHGVGTRTGEGARNASLIPQLEELYVALSIVCFPATGRIRNAVIRARTGERIRAMQSTVFGLVLGAPIAVTLAWYHGHRSRHRPVARSCPS